MTLNALQVQLHNGAQPDWICVVISPVTAESPRSPHPHQLVGRNCVDGVFRARLDPGQTTLE